MSTNSLNRRDFLKTTAVCGSGAVLVAGCAGVQAAEVQAHAAAASPFAGTLAQTPFLPSRLPDLAPARWIWYPSGRTLANTFVLFRREVDLPVAPRRVTGWIAADSRYLLEVNGQRIQWGPAPSDPRWAEADPVDLTSALRPGRNVIGATVLYYGHGDGTWPIGKPGFLFWLEIEHADGRKETIVSDAAWRALLCRAWRPGQYKRWFLRALQEEFDARLYPYGWSRPEFVPTQDWLAAMPLDGSANKPVLSATYYDYAFDVGCGPAGTELRPRSIPLMRESLVPVQKLSESLWLEWLRPPQEYFEFRTPDAFKAVREPSGIETAPGVWQVKLDGVRGAALTFELAEQVVGWPYFMIEAPAGTVVELMVHEGHQIGGPALLNTHYDSWTRFTCREGENRFECFDFESLRWLQLHLHGVAGTVTIHDVGVRRRMFPWPNQPNIHTNEPALQRLFDASVNTLYNSAQETIVDGMGRERQQGADAANQLHPIHLVLGETRLPARFLTTFSQGMTKDGYFLDTWPSYDRMARLMERQLDLTVWAPLIDGSVQFFFDCWHHFNYTGDLNALREPYPRLLRFADYLRSLQGKDGLLPVENIGVPNVFGDHDAYRSQRHKQCAFNLFTAAALRHALTPICRAFGDTRPADTVREFGRQLEAAAVKRFWCPQRQLFVNNLPWLAEEKNLRLCDGSLAIPILYDQCPKGRTEASLQALADCPPELGIFYPASAGKRLWALAKGGRADVIVKDFRERWATMDSVKLNNTIWEGWSQSPDDSGQWSHSAVVALYVTLQGLAGIRPLAPGFVRAEVRPQLADLDGLEVTAHTVRGPLHFSASGVPGNRELTIEPPPGCQAEVVLRREENVDLPRVAGEVPAGNVRYALPATRTTLKLKHT
jgi:hypothetical protein